LDRRGQFAAVDQNPYHGVPAIRSGVFERIAAGFEKLVVVPDEIFEADGGRVVVLGYYHGKFSGASEELHNPGCSHLDGP
jgi:hypothetical protein